jgi:hypothetical protein
MVARVAQSEQYLGYELYDRPSIPDRDRKRFYYFATASRPALGPNQPPIKWLPGALSPAVKRPSSECHHSSLCTAELKKAWSNTATPYYFFMVKLSLCILTKHHAMKAYWGSGGIAPLIL